MVSSHLVVKTLHLQLRNFGDGLSHYYLTFSLKILFTYKQTFFFPADSLALCSIYIISLLCDIRIVLHVLLLRYLHLSKYTAGPGQPSFLL